MKFYSTIVSATLFCLSNAADEADYNFDIAPLDVKSLDADAPMNVILMKKAGVASAEVHPMSLQVTTEIKGQNIVGGVMTKQQYETILNDKNSAYTIELDGVVTALGGIEERDSLRRNLAEETPYGIPMVLEDVNFWKNLGTPSGSIKVCVADTGYNLGHVDLPNGSDVTGTNNPSYSDGDDQWNYDGNSHGTHCAGTVAALGGNNQGVVGVIPNNAGGKFQLVIGKALQDTGSGSWTGMMKAVELCIAKGAKVVSMSLGGSGYSSSMYDFFKKYYEQQDILFIAAAGNDGYYNSEKLYPASYGSVMSVAAVDSNQNKADFSQYNDQVEISGPGKSVKSTIPGGEYGYLSGTSMATPHVAAVAGLLWMYFPQCKNYQIRNVILKTAKDRGTSGCDENYGYGIVQAKAAYDLLAQGNCGGNLGYTNTTIGGCGQLKPSGPSFAPVTPPTSAPVTPAPVTSPTNPPYCGKSEVKVSITTDAYGSETSYYIKDSSGSKVMEGAGFASNANRVDTKCFDNGSYTFTINDTYGDGICCIQGNGSYSVKVNGAEVASGGEFSSSESKYFSVSNTSPTNAPNPTAYPTDRAPTMYPTHKTPTMFPTHRPPIQYPSVGGQCATRGAFCRNHNDCCKKKCKKKKKICIK